MESGYHILLMNVLTAVVLTARVPDQESGSLATRGRNKDHDNTTYEPTENISLPADAKQIRWVQAAFDYLQNQTCKEAFFTTEKECKAIQKIPKSHMNAYLAGPSPYGKLRARLPDEELYKSGSHDAVVVLDPHPEANFGHLVLVFYVEIGETRTWCQTEGGTYLDGGECLILALRKRCKNAIERRNRRRNFARRCEIIFLPLVHLDVAYEGETDARPQMLTCRSNIPGFGTCAPLRSANETSGLFCDPIRENTIRCETSHETIQTSCRVFEICDQAVIVSGGWNRWTHKGYHKDNVWQIYRMLRNHGFNQQNIKIFFANGAPGIEGVNSTTIEQPVHPAALKLVMRYHLQKLCLSPHCVDSLVLYLNSPARPDGSSLLWDANRDGVMDESEVYTLAEMMTDLADCEAKQVHLVVDQSYSGEIARAFRRSQHHGNVIVYTSSRDSQYSYGNDFSRAWYGQNHTNTCAKTVFKNAKKATRHSSPTIHSGEATSRVNIFGAPCDVIPPFTYQELKDNYLGCQNLPTALWVMKFLEGTPRRTPRLEQLNVQEEHSSYSQEAGEDVTSLGKDYDSDYITKEEKLSRENESYDETYGTYEDYSS